MGNTQSILGFPAHIDAWSFLLSACSKRTIQWLQSVSTPGYILITQSKYLRLGVVFLKTLGKFMVRRICCEYHTEPFHCLRRFCILSVYFFLFPGILGAIYLFISAFIIARAWKQPKPPVSYECISKC